VDEGLAGLAPGQIEDSGEVPDDVGVLVRGVELLAEIEELLPLADRGGEVLRSGGESVLLEDVVAVEHGSGADVDRNAELLAVLGGGLLPLPVRVLALVVLGAECVGIHEEPGAPRELAVSFALVAGEVGRTLPGWEGSG